MTDLSASKTIDLYAGLELAPDAATGSAHTQPFTAETPRPSRYSMSLIRRAEQCVLSAKMDRDDGQVGGEDATFGRLFHEAAATVGFVAVMSGQRQLDADHARRVGQAVLERPDEPAPLSWEQYTRYMDMLDTWTRFAEFRPDWEQAVELPLRQVLPGTERTLSCRIDYRAIQGTTCFMEDYKTGPGLPSQRTVETHMQLPFYSLMSYLERPELDTFVCIENYVRHGVTREVVLDLDDVWRFEAYLRTAVARLDRAYATSDFPPTPGRACATCPAPGSCPLPKRARPWAITSDAELMEVLGGALASDADRKKCLSVAEAYMEGQGIQHVTVGGKQIGFFPKHERGRLNEKAAKAAGVDLDAFRGTSRSSTVFTVR